MKKLLIIISFISVSLNAQIWQHRTNEAYKKDANGNMYVYQTTRDSVFMEAQISTFLSDIQSDTILFTFLSNNAKPNGFYAFMNHSEYVQTNFLYLLRLCNLTFDPYNKERFNYYLRKNFFAIQI